jgi:hypothetical protein
LEGLAFPAELTRKFCIRGKKSVPQKRFLFALHKIFPLNGIFTLMGGTQNGHYTASVTGIPGEPPRSAPSLTNVTNVTALGG